MYAFLITASTFVISVLSDYYYLMSIKTQYFFSFAFKGMGPVKLLQMYLHEVLLLFSENFQTRDFTKLLRFQVVSIEPCIEY